MALRDCINNDEIRRLQKAHEENGGDWGKTRNALPGVDPKALDAGFKEFITSGKVASKAKKLTKAEEAELARLEAEEKAKDPLK